MGVVTHGLIIERSTPGTLRSLPRAIQRIKFANDLSFSTRFRTALARFTARQAWIPHDFRERGRAVAGRHPHFRHQNE